MNQEQHAKVMAFAEKARAPGAVVELCYGGDGLWQANATGLGDRLALTPLDGRSSSRRSAGDCNGIDRAGGIMLCLTLP